MAVFLCVCIFLMVSRLGDIKLGSDHDKPEHSNLSWFAMLFAAGMGIGLMFFAVAEPLKHYISPPTDYDNKIFNLYAYDKKQGWLSGWTLFYWGWWIAWSPFVGMFIARVSKGRTIREFLIGVLFIPVGFTLFWMTVFGNSSIKIIQLTGGQDLVQAVQTNVPKALFIFFDYLPFSTITSLVAMVLIIIFFVTSADSGALVIDIIATGNAKDSISWQRVCWSLLEGLLAISLLYTGGLVALQTATIISAFPFLLVLILICISLIKALRYDYLKR